MAFRVEGVKYAALKKADNSLPPEKFPERDRLFVTEDFYQVLNENQRKDFILIGKFKLKGISSLQTVYCHTKYLK